MANKRDKDKKMSLVDHARLQGSIHPNSSGAAAAEIILIGKISCRPGSLRSTFHDEHSYINDNIVDSIRAIAHTLL